MNDPSVDEVGKLLQDLALPMYQVKRDMELPFDNHRQENNAEHSWTLSLMACSLAPRIDKHLDIGKIAQLAIVHDLVEIHAGDTSVWDHKDNISSKVDREHEAFLKISKDFSNFPWIIKTIKDYEDKNGKEAVFVWALDKLAAIYTRLLDYQAGGNYYVDVKITAPFFQKRLQATRKKAYAHPLIGKYYDEIMSKLLEHPEWFYKK